MSAKLSSAPPDVASTLRATLPAELVDALLTAYTEIEANYIHRKWKASELDAGHFVEAARRIVEHRLLGVYTPLGKGLPKFNDAVMKQYESQPGDESYRLLIPRALRAVYGIRNNRGVGHLGPVSPNEMDATFILYSVKWVLAEILRLESGLAPSETHEAIARIVQREGAILWKSGDVVRVSRKGVSAREQVLLFLYDSSPQAEAALQEACEYRNLTNFRKILRRLHGDRLLYYGPDRICVLMPNGVAVAEAILRKPK